MCAKYDKVGLTLLQFIWTGAHGPFAPAIFAYSAPLLPSFLEMAELNDVSACTSVRGTTILKGGRFSEFRAATIRQRGAVRLVSCGAASGICQGDCGTIYGRDCQLDELASAPECAAHLGCVLVPQSRLVYGRGDVGDGGCHSSMS